MVNIKGSGELEFPEFVNLAAQFLVEEDAEEMQNELKEAFRLYDKEGNGYITTATLREILHELDDKLTPDDLDGIIAEIDEDGSGTIDFDGNFYYYFKMPLFIHSFLKNRNNFNRIYGNDDGRVKERTAPFNSRPLLLFFRCCC